MAFVLCCSLTSGPKNDAVIQGDFGVQRQEFGVTSEDHFRAYLPAAEIELQILLLLDSGLFNC